MRLILNLIWFVFGGFIASFLWLLAGLVLSFTVIGLPFGLQCFKAARLTLVPFGQSVDWDLDSHPLVNIIWAVLVGWEMALGYLAIAAAYAVTVIGIPFAIQWVKLAKLALLPFGTKIR